MEKSPAITMVAWKEALPITTTTSISTIPETLTYRRHPIYLPKYLFLKTRTIEIILNQAAIITLALVVLLIHYLFDHYQQRPGMACTNIRDTRGNLLGAVFNAGIFKFSGKLFTLLAVVSRMFRQVFDPNVRHFFEFHFHAFSCLLLPSAIKKIWTGNFPSTAVLVAAHQGFVDHGLGEPLVGGVEMRFQWPDNAGPEIDPGTWFGQGRGSNADRIVPPSGRSAIDVTGSLLRFKGRGLQKGHQSLTPRCGLGIQPSWPVFDPEPCISNLPLPAVFRPSVDIAPTIAW
ncbi:MAG: hypothetical protein P8010_06910 [Desulfosarcinaceae bacterium]